MTTVQPTSVMMTALRDHFGGHEEFQKQICKWRADHPIKGASEYQWPPIGWAISEMYKHFIETKGVTA